LCPMGGTYVLLTIGFSGVQKHWPCAPAIPFRAPLQRSPPCPGHLRQKGLHSLDVHTAVGFVLFPHRLKLRRRRRPADVAIMRIVAKRTTWVMYVNVGRILG